MTEVVPHWPGEDVRVGGWQLHVRRSEATSPDTEPAVFVHGLGGASTNWTDLMGLLSDRLHGVAPDLPGFGFSPPPGDGDYSPAGHTRAVVDLIESGGSPVHLVGNSLGGAVATRLAALRPELVRTLTLVAPALPSYRLRTSNAHLPALAVPFVGERLARLLARAPVEQRVRTSLRLCYADPSCVPMRRFEEAVEEARRRAALTYEDDALLSSLRGLLVTYLDRGQQSLWRLAAQVQAPTLLVYGRMDRLVEPSTALRAARTFPHARLVVLPRSGHVVQMEHPAVVARAIREHLGAAQRPARRPPLVESSV